jgi:myo-inositol-1(or 4)-monophosphatase
MPGPDPDPLDADELADLADLAEAVARQAARLLLDGLHRDRLEIDTKSTATDMVSEMDRAAERLIVDALIAVRPDDGVMGEEGASRPSASGVTWVIDPLDGTTNYLYRHPGFTVSIAAEHGGRAVAGVVVDVLAGEVFRAMRGGGATRDGRPIAVSSETELGRALVATGFGYQAEQRRHQAAVLAQVLPDLRDIRRMGSAALDLCSVACARVDAYYELSLGPWDFAAGALIAAEAGAVVTDLDGAFPRAAPLLAAPPALAGPLRALLVAAGARHRPQTKENRAP